MLIFTVVVYGFSLNPFIRMIKLEDNEKVGVLVVGANKISVAIARLMSTIDNMDVTVVDSNRKRVQYARIDGVKAMHTSIFSPRVLEDMQLGAYQYLLSLTENDEVNSLSCIQYSEIVGSTHVFRFPPTSLLPPARSSHPRSSPGPAWIPFPRRAFPRRTSPGRGRFWRNSWCQ